MAEVEEQESTGTEPDSGQAARVPTEAEEKLLKQIRDAYKYFLQYWRENREQSEIDMQYANCQGWTTKDLEERKGRPSLWPDELSQYVKQVNNNARQNPTEIVVKPKGEGATDEDAERREAIIRGIQYSSSAQAAYTTAIESAAWSAFGAYRIINEVVNHGNANQQPRIKRIPNAMTVLWDPHALEADFSDQKKCFVLDIIRKDDFAEKYPDAKKQSFSAEDQRVAPEWLQGETLLLAEYWKVTKTKGEGNKKKALPHCTVTQYITNGVEILETNEWPGSWIPIIGVFGEELYVTDGGQSKRMFLSLIRRARDPQKKLAYIDSQETEEFGMSPRTPFVGYAGTFKDWETVWSVIHKVPFAFAEVQIPNDWQPQWGPPPVPTRPQFIPNAAAYEVARESARRSIQAAMGLTPLPTAAQRQNEKSGVALDRIQNQEAVGSYHIIDNSHRALENCGRQLNELVTLLFDTPRQVGVRQEDGSHELLNVLQEDQDPIPGKEGEDYLVTDRGEFDVTISEGASKQSQRDAQSDFADLMVEELPKIAQMLPPGVMAKVMAAAVKLKNIGPQGDALVELLDPPNQGQPTPEQLQQTIQQLKAQLDEAGVLVQKYEQERAGKIIESQTKLQIAKDKNFTEAQQFEIEQLVKLEVAEISTKAQVAQQRADILKEIVLEMHGAAHELGLQKDQQGHEQTMGQQQIDAQKQQQATDLAGQSALASQGHQQNMEQQQAAPETNSQ